jgi:hypothetical protein
MRRLNRDDQGITIPLVAVAMLSLILFASLALDIGQLVGHRKLAQDSADTQALAAAVNCALGQSYDTAPMPPLKSGQSVVFSTVPCDYTKGEITATVDKTVTYQFTPGSPTAEGKATAAWGALGYQVGVFPITVGNCSFTGLTLNKPVTLHSYNVPGCPNPSGNFGFISNGCDGLTVVVGDAVKGQLPGTTGNNLTGTDCNGSLDQFLGHDVLVPVWDVNSGTGSNGSYHIISFALFTVTGWSTNGGNNHGGTLNAMCDGTADGDPFLPAPADQNKPCIRGYFKGFTANTGSVVPGMQCGAATLLACRVYLTQ